MSHGTRRTGPPAHIVWWGLVLLLATPLAGAHGVDDPTPQPPDQFREARVWEPILDPPMKDTTLCWVDPDGDGMPELVLENQTGRIALRFYPDDGFRRVAYPDEAGLHCPADAGRAATFQAEDGCITRDGGVSVCGLGEIEDIAVADFNGDGHPDVLVARHHDAEPMAGLVLLRARADGLDRVTNGSLGTMADWWTVSDRPTAVAVADFDLDGNPDAAVASDDKVRVLRNSGADGHFVVLRLDGPSPAEVTLRADDGRLHTSTTPTPQGQENIVHFGLGEAGTAEAVTVRWADGTVSTWQDLRANRFYALGPDTPAQVLRDGPLVGGLQPPSALDLLEEGNFTSWLAEAPDGTRVYWEFGDGAWAEGLEARHAYHHAGRFHVRVHAYSPDGLHATRAGTVDVGMDDGLEPVVLAPATSPQDLPGPTESSNGTTGRSAPVVSGPVTLVLASILGLAVCRRWAT